MRKLKRETIRIRTASQNEPKVSHITLNYISKLFRSEEAFLYPTTSFFDVWLNHSTCIYSNYYNTSTCTCIIIHVCLPRLNSYRHWVTIYVSSNCYYFLHISQAMQRHMRQNHGRSPNSLNQGILTVVARWYAYLLQLHTRMKVELDHGRVERGHEPAVCHLKTQELRSTYSRQST